MSCRDLLLVTFVLTATWVAVGDGQLTPLFRLQTDLLLNCRIWHFLIFFHAEMLTLTSNGVFLNIFVCVKLH